MSLTLRCVVQSKHLKIWRIRYFMLTKARNAPLCLFLDSVTPVIGYFLLLRDVVQ